MKKNLLALSLALAFTSIPSILHAEADIGAGKEKAAQCASCHGETGNSLVSSFPKLAEQHPNYLVKQLLAFKSGARKDPLMSPIAQHLSQDDIADIAAYYASEKIAANDVPVLDEDEEDATNKAKNAAAVQALITQGGGLYRNGDLSREVSACIACHGPLGEGNKPAGYPSLKSQHAEYLIKTLTDFKTDVRSNNPENMMHMIARKMTDEEIKAVSYRISMMK